MKLLIIKGSPAPEGNSSKLAAALIEGAEEQGAEIEQINIYDYNISDVWKNYFGDALQNKFEKAGADNMPALKEKMLAANTIVLVSPVYWYQLSGRMKTFVDRWTDTINPDFSSDLAGKGLALVTTHSGMNVMNSSNYLQLAMEGTARFLGMHWMGAVEAPIKLPVSSGAIPAHYELAKDFGAKLASGQNLIGQKISG